MYPIDDKYKTALIALPPKMKVYMSYDHTPILFSFKDENGQVIIGSIQEEDHEETSKEWIDRFILCHITQELLDQFEAQKITYLNLIKAASRLFITDDAGNRILNSWEVPFDAIDKNCLPTETAMCPIQNSLQNECHD